MRISDWSSDVCSSDLLVAEHEEAIVGIFLGMAAPYYFSEGQVSTALEFVIAPPFRRRNLATRLLRGYVAWAKDLALRGIQCGTTTILAAEETSHTYDRKRVVKGKRVSVLVGSGGG